MRQNMRTRGSSSEKTVKDIRRATRKQYSAEEKIPSFGDAKGNLARETENSADKITLSRAKSPLFSDPTPLESQCAVVKAGRIDRETSDRV